MSVRLWLVVAPSVFSQLFDVLDLFNGSVCFNICLISFCILLVTPEFHFCNIVIPQCQGVISVLVVYEVNSSFRILLVTPEFHFLKYCASSVSRGYFCICIVLGEPLLVLLYN